MSLWSPLSHPSPHSNLNSNSTNNLARDSPYQPQRNCIPAHDSRVVKFTSHLRKPSRPSAHLTLLSDMSCGSGQDAQDGQTNPQTQNDYWPGQTFHDDRFGLPLMNFEDMKPNDLKHAQLSGSSTEVETMSQTIQDPAYDVASHWLASHGFPSVDPANQMMYGNPHDLFAHVEYRNDCENDDTHFHGTSYPSTNFNDEYLVSSPSTMQMELHPHRDNRGIDLSTLHMDSCISSPESFVDGDPGSPEEHEADMPYNKRIYHYLLRAPGYELTLKELYRKFEEDVIHSVNPSSKGWQNSIRHNLSMNEAFQKGSRDPNNAKKNVWSLTDEAIQNGIQPTTRFRNHNRSRLRTRHLQASVLRPPLGAKAGSTPRRSTRARPIPGTYRARSDSLPDGMFSREATAAPPTLMEPSMSPEISNMHLRTGDQFQNFPYDHNYPSPSPFTFPMEEDFAASALASFESIVPATNGRNTGNMIDPALMLKLPDTPKSPFGEIENHDNSPRYQQYQHPQQQNHLKTTHIDPSNLTAFYFDGGRSGRIHNLTDTHGPELFYSSTDEEVNSEPITPGEYPTVASPNVMSSGREFFGMPPYSNV